MSSTATPILDPKPSLFVLHPTSHTHRWHPRAAAAATLVEWRARGVQCRGFCAVVEAGPNGVC